MTIAPTERQRIQIAEDAVVPCFHYQDVRDGRKLIGQRMRERING
jgi:hypothetical protein